MMRARGQILTGFIALAVVGVVVWAGQRPTVTVLDAEPTSATPLAAVEPAPNMPVCAEPLPDQPTAAAPVSGIKGVDLPPDPQIPIPLYHPRSDMVGGVNSTVDFVQFMPPAPSPPSPTPDPCDDTVFAPPMLPPTTPEPPLVTPVVNVSTPVPTLPVAAIPNTAALTPNQWRLSLEMVGTGTQFELRRADETLVRVQCEALDFSSPSGGLIARGKVVVFGPGIEARCETVTIAWQTGQVALDGGVQLSFRRDGVVQLMRAESLTFRLAGANGPVEFTTKDVQMQVAPKP